MGDLLPGDRRGHFGPKRSLSGTAEGVCKALFLELLIRCLKFHLLEKGCVCFQNEAAFDEIFQKANFSTFVFRNRVKLETYNVSTAGSGDVYQLLDSYCRILDDVILGKRN